MDTDSTITGDSAVARGKPLGRSSVAVTGASGGLGRLLVRRLLEEGVSVRALVRVRERWPLPPHDDLSLHEGSLEDLRSGCGLLEGVDAVFHLAGERHDESRMHRTHVMGTERLLDAARASGVSRVVLVSTLGVYGALRAGRINEESSVCPVTAYESTKAQAEALAREVSTRSELSCLVVRPGIVYGPKVDAPLVHQIARVARGGILPIPACPHAWLPMVAEDDLIDALLHVGNWEYRGTPWRVWHIADELRTEEWLRLVASGTGGGARAVSMPRTLTRAAFGCAERVPGGQAAMRRLNALTREVRFVATRARRELGWVPQRSHRAHIVRTLEEARG